MGTINVGIDPAQRVDNFAVVVCELEAREDGEHYLARHVERLRQGAPYPQQVERVKAIYDMLKAAGHDITVYLDATGVGQPISDLFKDAGITHTAVWLTNGHQETRAGSELHLPKNLMVSRLQVLLQQKRIHLPDTQEARALEQELLTYEIKVTESANLQMGVFRVGKHDDLATALGLACREGSALRMPLALSW